MDRGACYSLQGGRVRHNWSDLAHTHMIDTMYKTDNWKNLLYSSVLCAYLNVKEIQKKGDVCIH